MAKNICALQIFTVTVQFVNCSFSTTLNAILTQFQIIGNTSLGVITVSYCQEQSLTALQQAKPTNLAVKTFAVLSRKV